MAKSHDINLEIAEAHKNLAMNLRAQAKHIEETFIERLNTGMKIRARIQQIAESILALPANHPCRSHLSKEIEDLQAEANSHFQLYEDCKILTKKLRKGARLQEKEVQRLQLKKLLKNIQKALTRGRKQPA